MVGPLIVREKLAVAMRHVRQLSECLPSDPEPFARESHTRNSALWSFCQATQCCVDAANHMVARYGLGPPMNAAHTFEKLRDADKLTPDTADLMIRAVGLRNRLTHRYGTVDWALAHQGCLAAPDAFEQFAREIRRRGPPAVASPPGPAR